MKTRKIFAVLLACAMVLAGIGGSVTAKAESTGDYVIMTPGAQSIYPVVAGGTLHFQVPVQLTTNALTFASDVFVTVESANNLFDNAEGKLTKGDKKNNGLKILPEYPIQGVDNQTYVEFDLTIRDTAKIGTYDAAIKLQFSAMTWDSYGEVIPISGATIPFKLRVIGEKAPAQMTVSNMTYEQKEAVIDGIFDLSFDTQNMGDISAVNTFLSMDFGDSGIVPNYSTPNMQLGDIGAHESKHHKLSLRVLPTAEAGLKTITMVYTYKNAEGESYTSSVSQYINIIKAAEVEKKEAKLTAQAKRLESEIKTDSRCVIEVTIENIGAQTAKNVTVTIPENGGIGAAAGILPGYVENEIQVSDIKPGEKKTVSLPLLVTKSASEGIHEINAEINYENSKGIVQTAAVKTYLTIAAPEKQPEVKNDLVISQITQYPEAPVAGETMSVSFLVTNNGNNDISNLVIYAEGLSNNGFEPLTADAKYKVGMLAPGESSEVSLYFRLGNGISEGMNELHIAVAYTDADGASRKEETTVYVLNVKQVTKEQIKNSIAISNISQSPAVPLVGEKVTVSFQVTNNGTKEITDMKFAGANLSSSGFEPISSEVYTKVGTIAAGASKQVSMTFKVGENIAEGFNTLSLEFSYQDGNGDVQTEQTSMYILDVKNQSAATSSRPKLIVEEYSCSSDELRAGTTFDFTFKLQNTHTSKAAKNMTVTVLQAQDIFSATQGSNSFYIASIEPGESVERTINLKVKSDTATGVYDLCIKVAYEYDDMSQADLQTGGVTEELPIKLQAIENTRPALQNLSVGYDWDTPTVNQSTSLMFDFYNMGKSTLNNVYITMESDYFQFETGTSAIIGSVAAGYSNYQEISILPVMEGMASGKLIVHFEDSNGDEVTKEFDMPEVYVQGEPNYNWNEPMPGGDDFPTYSDDINTAKAALMPVWAYVLSLVGALVLGTLVTRGIVIAVYKKKHSSEEED